jgi:2-polyprenyl-6-hydroxyphenyl methylase/3-demethylubiquinone-9 3-methyltransferase
MTRPVDNSIYETLGERWYEAEDDPVALLRAEARLRNPWVSAMIARKRREAGVAPAARVLDIGCGAGFLTNALAGEGHEVTGIDASPASLAVAGSHDPTRTVRYVAGDALSLPFADASFDVVCAMDFLEHVEEPARVVAEAARVLTPGGLFFFHTFDRNPIAWLIAIKGVEWFVRNVPADMHVLRLFVKPRELRAMSAAVGLEVAEVRGSGPDPFTRPFWNMIATGRVSSDFRFRFTRSTWLGYTGYAHKVVRP